MAHPQIPYFKSWLIYSVSSMVLGFLCGLSAGMVLGGILGAVGAPIETVKIVCGGTGFVLGLIASFIMFRWVVDRFIVPAITENAASLV